MKPTTTVDGVPLAGLGRRFVARLIDGLLTGTVATLLTLPFLLTFLQGVSDWVDEQNRILEQGGVMTSDPFTIYSQTGFWTYAMVSLAAYVLVTGLYTVLLIRFKGATLGKKAMHVRVRPVAAEGLPTWGQATTRWLMYEVLGEIVSMYALLDILWPLWDTNKQALHDKVAKTIVVSAP
ncbi:MAG: RDD family protein [Kineosporiaceae bacterium]